MVSATTASIKPSRSEDLADAQEQLRIEEEVRRRFDEEAPKRHRKPLRSDIDTDRSGYVDDEDAGDDHEMSPEYIKLQTLVHDAHDQHVVQEFPNEVPEEFVETEYYKDLNSVDQSLHHATGTGFIQMEKHTPAEVLGFDLEHTEETGIVRTTSHSNPAMNDWIPSLDTAPIPESDKPHRSEP